MQLKDYLNSINYTKENLLDENHPDCVVAEKRYTPFIINRCMSNFLDTILFVNEINIRPQIDKKLQYDYLINIVRKRKRFSKWLKPTHDENFKSIKEMYNVSNEKAREILSILTDEQLQQIKTILKTRDG